jgi:Zn-dependent alcohol dehydrogenase
VDASREDPVARAHAISGMGGVDFAFEVVGTQKTVEQALASTHRGGMSELNHAFDLMKQGEVKRSVTVYE